MRLRTIFHLGIKELRSLRRDRIMMALILFAFTGAIYSAATAQPDMLNNAAIAIVDEDRSPLSNRITGAFFPPNFAMPRLITPSEMDARLDAGDDTFALNIPPGFQRDLLAGRTPEVQLNVDATRMNQAFTGSGYIQNILIDEIAGFMLRGQPYAQPVELALRTRFNPTLDNIWFGAVVELVGNITMLSIILTGAALIREREHGTVDHLLVMPVTPAEIMIAKIWSMALVVFCAAALSLTFVVHGLLQVPLQGPVPVFLAGAAVLLLATTSMGIFLATLARSMPQFGLLIILVLVPMEMLSGGVTPRESMPDAVRYLMLGLPTTHFVMLAQAVLYRGAGLAVVWPNFVALGAIAATLFAGSLWLFRKSLA